ncbi:MAG: N-acetylmuramoyl-L-alanine amidase [Proteobacteria bacterium]|nr:N-acetylmuramoyl-L-alanine amidase [Pseudomonadota bacterium]
MPTDPVAIHLWPLPYLDRLDARAAARIDLVVIHCTELPDLAMAREYGERILHPASQTGNSGHWYIDRDGSIHEFVNSERIAHHVRGFNAHSVGIELVNAGRYPDWLDSRHQAMDEPYPPAQIAALIGLLATLRQRLPNLRQIAGHEDLDTEQVPASDDATQTVARKRDPGPLFPWEHVLAAVPLQRLLHAPTNDSAPAHPR